MPGNWRILLTLPLIVPLSPAQETHSHPAPEKLGKVSFLVSCAPAVQGEFNKGVALLHSFAYTAAESTFQKVAALDHLCAMAHWGVAMTLFQPLWPTRPGPRRSAKRLAGSGDRQVAGAADTARTAFHQRG